MKMPNGIVKPHHECNGHAIKLTVLHCLLCFLEGDTHRACIPCRQTLGTARMPGT